MPSSQHFDLGLSGAFATDPPRQVIIKDLVFSSYSPTVTLIMNRDTSKVGLEARIQSSTFSLDAELRSGSDRHCRIHYFIHCFFCPFFCLLFCLPVFSAPVSRPFSVRLPAPPFPCVAQSSGLPHSSPLPFFPPLWLRPQCFALGGWSLYHRTCPAFLQTLLVFGSSPAMQSPSSPATVTELW